jgi:two-component system, chemotaxis family, chemotaxis protein CheY
MSKISLQFICINDGGRMAFGPDMKILVIDDMSTMRIIVKNMLKKLGFTNMEQANDGDTAWPMIVEALETDAPFELIVSDWNMPIMTGIDLLRKVRAHEKLKTLPFLMVTAESEQSSVVEAVQAGVSNFVIKPFDEAILKDKIAKIFAANKAA